jgi:hypothetical protein
MATEAGDQFLPFCGFSMYQYENWATASRGTTISWYVYTLSENPMTPYSLIDDSQGFGIN